MDRGNILVVDDEPINYKLLNVILGQEGYKVEYADGGYSAVEMVGKFDYNLVIMDLKMPDMTGIEASKQIKKLKPKVNIVASSAVNNIEKSEYMLFNDFLSKPINRGQLLEIVEKYAK